MRAAPPSSTTLRYHFLADHRRLEHLFDRLVCAMEADAREDIEALWGELEQRLLGHMEIEDKFLLPGLATMQPETAADLRKDHLRFRTRLMELDEAVDLHLARLDVVRSFLDELRTHARREDELLYSWAEQHLSEERKAGLIRSSLETIERRLHTIAANEAELPFTD
ncbi:MAG: hemerythrin domain-containing protein [Polyangiaceae bacterium]